VIDLERRLQALAADLDWPETVDVTDAVLAGITERRAPAIPRWSLRLRPALTAAAAVLVLATAVLLVSPGARSAVASWLGLGGVAVERTTEPATPQTQDLNLGEPVSARDAQAAVDFPIRGVRLRHERLFLDRSIPGGMVSLVYPPQRAAPETGTPFVGAILTQFEADPSDPFFTKEIMARQDVEFIEIPGGFAMWVSGPSHMLLRTDDGEPLRHTARLSANALVWTAPDGLTYRLESALDRADAIALMETMGD
jgi:hypothetical protein